jgi:hypothetical protein
MYASYKEIVTISPLAQHHPHLRCPARSVNTLQLGRIAMEQLNSQKIREKEYPMDK